MHIHRSLLEHEHTETRTIKLHNVHSHSRSERKEDVPIHSKKHMRKLQQDVKTTIDEGKGIKNSQSKALSLQSLV